MSDDDRSAHEGFLRENFLSADGYTRWVYEQVASLVWKRLSAVFAAIGVVGIGFIWALGDNWISSRINSAQKEILLQVNAQISEIQSNLSDRLNDKLVI